MARYVLIGSRDPFESNDVPYYHALAGQLAKGGEQVALFLVQNGVLACRESAPGSPMTALAGMGVEILADAFSMRERGIAAEERHPAVRLAEIGELVDRMTAAPGVKVLWH